MSGIEGNDGRLYFNYGVGAEFKLFCGDAEVARIRITDCFYDFREDTEKYEVENGVNTGELPYSISRLEKLLYYGRAEELDCGVAREYPLMKEEVYEYYEAKRQAMTRARNEAEKYMEATTGYKALKKQCDELGNLLAKAITENRENADVLLEKYGEVKEKLYQMISGKGKNPKLFEPPEVCPKCRGNGLTESGEICACARDRTDAIKRWNAEQRLKRHFGETWAVRLHGDEYGERIPADKHIAQPAPGQLESGE